MQRWYTLRIIMAVFLKYHRVLFNGLLLKKKLCIKSLIYRDQNIFLIWLRKIYVYIAQDLIIICQYILQGCLKNKILEASIYIDWFYRLFYNINFCTILCKTKTKILEYISEEKSQLFLKTECLKRFFSNDFFNVAIFYMTFKQILLVMMHIFK